MESHRTELALLTKKQLLDVVRLYNAEKRIPITFRMPQADILKYLLTDKSIDHTLLEKVFKQIKVVSAKLVPVKKGSKDLVPAIVKKSQPKKTNTKPSLQPDISVKGRGRGRPAGSKNRFRPEFSNQSVPTLKVFQ
jgi:hypothetical protein